MALRFSSFTTANSLSKELRNPNDVELVCPHCGSREFYYRILCEHTVIFPLLTMILR